ncbi:phosphatase [Gordonia phage BrutonGaster]|uniref:Phosphatase n=1 Tax=Gordonia phage BrutonGaster TaxID=2530116 RepID=A0A482JN83_9CAUD|nr:phosphatase [Gordonia phage BrutonGaster]QBP33334.1 phosphatase [Gordonia phage BrutonGaster]
MTEKTFHIGIDLDGVLYDFAGALRKFLVKHHGWTSEMCEEPQSWTFYENWGLNEEGFRFVCNRAATVGELFNVSDCTDWEAVRQVRRLSECPNLKLHIITARHFGAHSSMSHEATASWLRHLFDYDTLTFSNDKTIIKTDYFIEDSARNHVKLRRNGTKSYLLTQAWNHNAVVDPEYWTDNVDRVQTVRDFVEIVLDETQPAEVPF